MTEAEWRTRKTRVDKKLTHAGWAPEPARLGASFESYGTSAVQEYPTDSGPAD